MFNDKPVIQRTPHLNVTSTSGNDLESLGFATCTFDLDDLTVTHNFIICHQLKQPMIIGLDLQQKYKLGTYWGDDGKMHLHKDTET